MQLLLLCLGGLLFFGAALVAVGLPGFPGGGLDDENATSPTPEEDGDAPTDSDATETDESDDGDDGSSNEGGDDDTDDSDDTDGGDDAENDSADDAEDAVAYRVNVGGPAISVDGGADWSADGPDAPSQYLNADGSDTVATSTPDDITVENDVPSTAPTEMFQTYRWDRDSGAEMTYEFEVDPDREYEVRLYFLEAYFVEDESEARDGEVPYDEGGPRIFDVAIDDEVVLDDYEPYEEHGHDVGAVKAYDVTSDDGTITIRFGHEVEDPTVSGIEIVDTGPREDGNESDD